MNDELKELTTKLYQEIGLTIEPSYPRVLVRVLPKEQISKGGIILTDHQQNKPTHEGIVIAVYKSFWKTIVKSDRLNWEKRRAQLLMKLLGDDSNIEKEMVWMEAPVKLGDHILFPHIASGITPVWPLDDGKGDYRLVPDDQILATLAYSTEKLKYWLSSLIENEKVPEKIVDKIMEHATVIRTDSMSKTVSGR